LDLASLFCKFGAQCSVEFIFSTVINKTTAVVECGAHCIFVKD